MWHENPSLATAYRFKSGQRHHVGTSDISLAPTFFKSQGALILLPLLLREKSRLLRLRACKRARNASAALPTFRGGPLRRPFSLRLKNIDFNHPLHVGMDCVPFKIPSHSTGDFSYRSVIPPLRKKSRSARLFGCSGLKSRLRPSRRLAVATNFLRVCALRRWRFILSHLYKVMSKEVDC